MGCLGIHMQAFSCLEPGRIEATLPIEMHKFGNITINCSISSISRHEIFLHIISYCSARHSLLHSRARRLGNFRSSPILIFAPTTSEYRKTSLAKSTEMETCSICQKLAPRPHLICTRNTDNPTYYCDTRCRDRNQSRTIVHRTGDLLQQVFCAFREAAFDLEIHKLETKDGKLHVYKQRFAAGGADGPLYPFPTSGSLRKRTRRGYFSCTLAATPLRTRSSWPMNCFEVSRPTGNVC